MRTKGGLEMEEKIDLSVDCLVSMIRQDIMNGEFDVWSA